MNDYQNLRHPKWECKDHGVFMPKYRRKGLYGPWRQDLGEGFREWARQKASRIAEGHLPPAHGHLLLSLPPKSAVAQVVGYRKGKRASHSARTYGGRERNFVGEHFWARGYFVSPVGRDAEEIRRYIQEQAAEDKRREQLQLCQK